MVREVMRLKFAVVGGDKRAVQLCSLLRRDGHRVTGWALEKAALPAEIPRASCIQGCVYGADCIVLPVPAEKSGFLNAPYAEKDIELAELFSAFWPGQTVVGGNLSAECCLDAVSEGLCAVDLMRDADFVTGNAAITAECALSLLISSTERALYNSRVLIAGWGRLAKHLAFRTTACGAEVCIAARHPADLAMAQSLGLETAETADIETVIGEFDFIVNTVPARIFTQTALCCAESGSVIMELASAPGGFDRTLAENIGLRVINAPGLPGRYSPLSAAELMRDAIYDALTREEI